MCTAWWCAAHSEVRFSRPFPPPCERKTMWWTGAAARLQNGTWHRPWSRLRAFRWTVLRRITVPLIFANLIAGGLLAFAFAMLEVSDSLILAQRTDYYPITKAILDISQRLGDGMYVAAALGVWAMALLTLTILSANAFLGKKLGAIFRI